MAATEEAPLDLVVRFSTSRSDLILTVITPSATSALSLKQQIRAHLDPPASESRLRLIHAGKVLPDNVALSKSLNITAPPPTARSLGVHGNDTEDPYDKSKSEKAKGKKPIRPIYTAPIPPRSRVYIHCSIGDALPLSELDEELQMAKDADEALLLSLQTPSATVTAGQQEPHNVTTTTPAPRGFDRLLNTGFTAPEIAALRAQFLAIQAHTHTPDTMPSGSALLALEEEWLDSGSTNPVATPEDGVGGAAGGGDDGSGGLDDMLYGNLIGFFWPVGAAFWLVREEGVWTRRRQVNVLAGVVVNLTLGVLRLLM
ncbi:hypothetical protein M433DRAFT_150248 [Acidomyces richmondensis BFW]|nr:MAG: hypothetical protein FE78DRAFT_94228 [Acidomyces sp. 'richmondensis']KYG49187.1 hypothetical protein M433DRAFT_150248 [Acidomyces richmondensis BFW]